MILSPKQAVERIGPILSKIERLQVMLGGNDRYSEAENYLDEARNSIIKAGGALMREETK